MPFRLSYSFALVIFQLTSAGLILISGPLLAGFWPSTLLQLLGLAFGIWAIVIMKRSNKFNIPPDVREGSKLVKTGIYKHIRHPMYTAVLLYFLPALIHHFSWWRLGYFSVLILTLLVKINYEERLLKNAFSEYKEYQRSSWHLIPFVY